MEKIKVEMNVTSSDEILNQMYQEYLSCPKAVKYLAKLGLNDQQIRDNIAKIFDFVMDLKYCDKCPGVDACQKENPLFCTKITYKSGYVDRELSPCKKFLERMVFQNQFLIRDFDDSFLGKEFADLSDDAPKNLALQRYMKFRKERINNWIYMTGMANSGRSFTAAVIAVDIAKRNLGPIIYANCTTRIGELLDYYYKDKDRFKREIERYSTVPVLILDDFGNEIKNDIVRDAIIFPILSTRAGKKLFTIITSDFKINEIITLYSTSKAAEIRAKQIGTCIKVSSGKEINLVDLPLFQ